MSKEEAKKFRNTYSITYSSSKGMQYDPNVVFEVIEKQKAKELSELLKGTDNEALIAYRDPKVRELVDFVMTAIISENKALTSSESFFPFTITRRYKSIDSLIHKMGKHDRITDYLGFKIIPESEHDILYSRDTVAQEMIDRRENIRKFVAEKFRKLSKTKKTSFASYCTSCAEVLDKLQDVFTDTSIDWYGSEKDLSATYATERKEYYEEQKKTLAKYLEQFEETSDNPSEKLSLDYLIEITNVNIKELLIELQNNMSNEVTLYQLSVNLMNIISESQLLHTLGISISDDPQRTKPKFKANGYRSNFIGLDLTINLDSNTTLTLPIECQIQTQEQYRDGTSGFSAHVKREGKLRKLKSAPRIMPGKRFSDPNGVISDYIEYLSYIQHITPEFAEASLKGDRVEIIPQDLYGELRQILQAEKGSFQEKIYMERLIEVYEKRFALFPSTVTMPIYISDFDIPQNKNSAFFIGLSNSVLNTMDASIKDGNIVFNNGLSEEKEEER